MVKVIVPASTANIGPGFDSLGLALNLYNEYIFEEIDGGLIIEGCPEIYNNEGNLIYVSFASAAERMGRKVRGLRIRVNSKIPVSRGLGSSSACIAGGVFGANALYKGGLSKDELFEIAVNIEGHPDNIAPCVYGALTASIMEGDRPYSLQYKVSDKLKFCALIPNFETSTAEARKILPETVTFADAVYNISRAAILLKALEEGDMNIIRIALGDKIHQPYRAGLIHECDEVKEICRRNGLKAMFISGSGPTLMTIRDDDKFPEKVMDEISRLSYRWEIKLLETDKRGLRVERI